MECRSHSVIKAGKRRTTNYAPFSLDLASPAFFQASHDGNGGRSNPMMQEKAYLN
jgi:hypothetical protein